MFEDQAQDDILFDRLVDGELSAAERRRLLASLDDQPGGWRRCALAFLEAQRWSEVLGEFVRDPVPAQAADEKVSVTPVSPAHFERRREVVWLAVAAGLLAAFTLGLTWRGGAPIAGNAPVPSGDTVAEVIPPPASHSPDAAGATDALTLWVRDEAGKARPLRVPLVDARTLDQQLGMEFQTGMPADVRSQLQDRGFDVRSKRRYAPLWLENGRPMIVPVEDTRIVPVSQSVY
jgi:anti-sigma factor RsiW